MTEEKQTGEFVSTREAAQMLGVALRTVQLWVEAGVLTAWKTAGGHRRVVRASVDALLQQKAAALAAVPVASKGARTSTGTSAMPFRLLVIEDEPALLKLYATYVERWNLPLELLTASDGFEGLLRIGEKRPDLVITDLRMPGMDGFRMLRSLRATPEFHALQVIVVTALAADEVAAQGGLPDGIPVFTKPVPFADLEKQIRARIQERQPGRSAEAAG